MRKESMDNDILLIIAFNNEIMLNNKTYVVADEVQGKTVAGCS